MPDTPATSLRWRVGFGVAITAAMAIATFMQHALGVLGPLIVEDLEISRAVLGALSSVFFGVGALCSLPVGPLVDRLGGHRVVVAALLLSAAGFGLSAAAPSLAWLCAGVVLTGLASAAVNPATNELLATRIALGRQGVLTGVKQSGVQLGAFVGGVGLAPLAIVLGWRGALAVTALVSVAALATTRVTAGGGPVRGVVAGGGPRAPLGGFVAWLTVYAFLMGAGMSASVAYLPLYVVESLELTVAAGGLAAALIGGVGVAARIMWGRYSERVADARIPLGVIAITATAAQLLVWAAAPGRTWLLWLGAAGLGLSAASWNAVGMLAIVRRFQAGGTGRVSGVVMTGFFTGLTIVPVLAGASIDAAGSYGPAWAGVAGLFGLAALLSVLPVAPRGRGGRRQRQRTAT